MKEDHYLSLFKVLDSEQQIITRTDQKAFTMLSLMGVFMVFFLVHFPKIQINWFNFIMLILYLVTALMALIQLIMVINPRIKRREKQDDLPEINPTYFKGIVSFESASQYGKYLRKIMNDDKLLKDLKMNMFKSRLKNGWSSIADKWIEIFLK